MAPNLITIALLICSFISVTVAARNSLHDNQPIVDDPSSFTLLKYHKGPLLSGKISVNLIWYGKFTPTQRGIISDFVTSLSSKTLKNEPSVATWWGSLGRYYRLAKRNSVTSSIVLGKQIIDEGYSLGKSITDAQIAHLAFSKSEKVNAVNVVLTASDVVVPSFCSSRCGTHSSSGKGPTRSAPYIWVGNAEEQCPGQCAWPFHQPVYGPQTSPLVAPNGDVGVDGMVINLAGLLAGTVTNPFGNGFYQGTEDAPLEVASACQGVYGKGAYPGYAGNLLVDSITGASYNANGVNGKKYLLPAFYDPATSKCSTLV